MGEWEKDLWTFALQDRRTARRAPIKLDKTGQPWSKLPRQWIVRIPKIWMGGSFDTKIIGLHPRSSIRLSGFVRNFPRGGSLSLRLLRKRDRTEDLRHNVRAQRRETNLRKSPILSPDCGWLMGQVLEHLLINTIRQL